MYNSCSENKGADQLRIDILQGLGPVVRNSRRLTNTLLVFVVMFSTINNSVFDNIVGIYGT